MGRIIKLPEAQIHNSIFFLRGKRVIIDADLAAFYGTSTRRLNEQVKRNLKRFPDDFMFRLTKKEFQILKSQNATSSWGGRRKLPLVFTEHGAVMAANVLSSEIAIQASVQVVRVFIKISEMLATHKDLAIKIEKLERKLERRLSRYDKEIHTLFEAIKQLMEPSNTPGKRIGYRRALEE